MEYLLKVSAVIAVFYLCYKLFLQRDTFFEQTRWFLLLGLLTAFIFPFFVIPIYIEYTPVVISYVISDSPVITENVEKPFNILDYLPIIYGIGILLFTIRFIIQLMSLGSLILKNKPEKQGRYRFVKSTNNVSPFSFFNWIVFNPNHFNEFELELVIAHEKVHIHQYHSIDTVLTQLVCIVLWFNPFIWLYNRDLKQNLEFIADQKTQNQFNKKSYQTILLKTTMPTHQLALTNNFYTSLIKKRIVMLHKSKSKKINLLKYALIAPALALFLMSFNTEEIYIEKEIQEIDIVKQNSNYSEEIKIIFTKDLTDNDLEKIKKELKKDSINFIYTKLNRNAEKEIISISAKFEGKFGNATWKAYNTENETIKPFIFFKNQKEFGVSLLENNTNNDTIKINNYSKNDTLTKWETKFIIGKPFDSVSKEEIITKNGDSIIFNKKPGSELKPWKITIGRNAVSYPDVDTIKWRSTKKRVGLNWVSDEDKKVNIHNNGESKIIKKGAMNIAVVLDSMSKNLKQKQTINKNSLYIIDGKETKINGIKKESKLAESIESISILKGDDATKAYGAKGKDGVVLITTKKAQNTTIYLDENKSPINFIGIEEGKKPIYIIDDKESTREEALQVKSNNFKSITSLGEKEAIKKYGKKAQDGAIEITTKK